MSKSTHAEFINLFSDRLTEQPQEAIDATEKAFYKTPCNGYLLYLTEERTQEKSITQPVDKLGFEEFRMKWMVYVQEHYLDHAKKFTDEMRYTILRLSEITFYQLLISQETLEKLAIDATIWIRERLIQNVLFGYLMGATERAYAQ